MFATPAALAALLAVPALAALAVAAGRERRRALDAWGYPPHADARSPAVWLTLAALALGTVALAGPRWGEAAEADPLRGRDWVLVIDVSRGMRADDAEPSRFGAARESLLDVLTAIERRGGQRVALVAFAARPVVLCPLTPDAGHARLKLEGLDIGRPPAAVGPGEELLVSGTRIGAALSLAVEALDPRFPGYRDVVLASDGDDPAADREWQAGVARARGSGVPVHALGVGEPAQVVLARDGSASARVRLDEDVLKSIADDTGGLYRRLAEMPDAGAWWRDALAGRPSREVADDLLPRPRDRTAPLLVLALGMLAWAYRPRLGRAPAVACVALLLAAVPADDPGWLAASRARDAERAGRWADAEADWRRVLADGAIPPARRAWAWTRLGHALARRSGGADADRLRAAVECFRRSLDDPGADAATREAAAFNLDLSKRLWNAARLKLDQGRPPGEPPPGLPEATPGGTGDGDSGDDPSRGGDKGKAEPRGQGPAKDVSRKPTPGAGGLPVLPDTDDAPVPGVPEANRHLDAARERNARLRQAQERAAHAGVANHPNNW